MKNKTLARDVNISKEDMDMIYSSFDGLFAESNELLASLENLEKQSSMMKTEYTEMLLKTDKLLDSMSELTSSTQ
jgi:uncharacterized protein YoxC